MSNQSSPIAPPHLAPLRWRDLVIVEDDGRHGALAYLALARLASVLQSEHPRGYGALIVIPRQARPPSDQARRAIHDAMSAAKGGLRRLCWFVEGEGFHAGMVRAVLAGLRLLPRVTCATAVERDFDAAVRWLLAGLRESDADLEPEVEAVRELLLRHRSLPPPSRRRQR